MKILGCDLHAKQQSIAMVDTETGELTEKLFPVRPVGGQFSRNRTICCLSAKSPAGGWVEAARGRLLARFLVLCRGRYFVDLMVLSES